MKNWNVESNFKLYENMLIKKFIVIAFLKKIFLQVLLEFFFPPNLFLM